MTEKGESVRGTDGASKVMSEGYGRVFGGRYCAEREERLWEKRSMCKDLLVEDSNKACSEGASWVA